MTRRWLRWRRRKNRLAAMRILIADAIRNPGTEQVQHFGNGDQFTVIATYVADDPTE